MTHVMAVIFHRHSHNFLPFSYIKTHLSTTPTIPNPIPSFLPSLKVLLYHSFSLLSFCLTMEDRVMMGSSLEDDRLVQMVRDFMESESPSPTDATSSKCRALTHRTQYYILQDILRSETRAEAKVRNYVLNLKRMSGKRDAKKTSSLRKWLVLKLKMEGLDASLCHTCWATSLGCPAGEYEYVEVNITEGENGSPVRLIVDIDFRSQFELARPTQYYREMTESLPVIFVGTENKLRRIISLLCSTAKQSLREKGLHVPPWRTTCYMQSKWFSGRHHHKEEQGVEAREAQGEDEIGEWVPPIVKPRKRYMGGASGLSRQFSDLTINCC